MSKMKVVRVGIQLVVSLALLSLVIVLFYIMDFNLNQSYYQGDKPLIEAQTANLSKVSSRQQPSKTLGRTQKVPSTQHRKQPLTAQGKGQKLTNNAKRKQSSKAQGNGQTVVNTLLKKDPISNASNKQQRLNNQNVLSHPPNIQGKSDSYTATKKHLSHLSKTGVSHPPIGSKSLKSQRRSHPLSNPPDRNSIENVVTSVNKVRQNVSKIDKGSRKKKRTRYLIYLCDKYRWCGGWGDRQKGFVSTSVLAIVTGRTFGINMSVPCDIKLFYIPNQINWYVKTPEIKGLSWQVVDWMNNASLADLESDFNKVYTRDVVFLKTNLDLISKISKSQRYGHLVPVEYRNISTAFGNGWHKLMKPTFHLEEHLDMFMDHVPDKGDLVCAHIRLQKNPTIPNDGVVLNSLSSVDSLWKFLSRFQKNASRIFIASDSIDVRKSARKHLGRKELDTNGLVLHIDRQRGWTDACVGFEMALLEQAVLTKCKVLVMSRSGFSGRAAMISRIKQTVFLFRNGTIFYKNRVIFH